MAADLACPECSSSLVIYPSRRARICSTCGHSWRLSNSHTKRGKRKADNRG